MTTKAKYAPLPALNLRQKETLEFLRVQEQPFNRAKLWAWGVNTKTFNALARRGFVRPVAGGWTTQKREIKP